MSRLAGHSNGIRVALALIFPVVALSAWLTVVRIGVQAQAPSGITSPSPGDTLVDVVAVEGTAVHPEFLRYEVAFYQEFNPLAGWIVFAQGDQPVQEGILAIWDTTVGRDSAPVFPDGLYRLRLRVVRADYNFDEFVVSDLTIANDTITPTATATITPTAGLASVTPGPGTPAATPLFGAGPLPTLTPFPTLTPQPTPVDAAFVPVAEEENQLADEQTGLLGQLEQVDTDRFTGAFWRGAVIVLYLFAALALYLILRGFLRRVWRAVTARLLD